ncbi:MAG: hypothetical protein Q9208_006652 [Pyrenodesmia sp. 3 TL-2023]
MSDSQGFHVVGTARKESVLADLRHKGMSAVRLEMTDEASIAACRDEVGKLVDGKLDILINNACVLAPPLQTQSSQAARNCFKTSSITHPKYRPYLYHSGRGLTLPATDTPLSSARLVYETNLFGPMALISSLISLLLLPARALIINLSSISALVPYVFGSVYASSKAALASYTRTLRAELAPFGVRVMLVMAGTVESNIGHAVENVLPEGSLYASVKHFYERRSGFSQKMESRPMETEVFARRLVEKAVRAEGGVVCRGGAGGGGGICGLKAGRRGWFIGGVGCRSGW